VPRGQGDGSYGRILGFLDRCHSTKKIIYAVECQVKLITDRRLKRNILCFRMFMVLK
jgi:hypothetical protein